jgi:hypothetical protein
MDEKEVIERPDKIVSLRERMRSRGWVCSSCGNLTTAAEPIPVPAPCERCREIAFETTDPRPQ